MSRKRLLLQYILMSAVAISPSSFLKLLCYVKGKPYKYAFEVKIGNEESAPALKDAIKEMMGETFHDVDTKSLVLWNISIPHNPNLTDNGSPQVFTSHLNNDCFFIIIASAQVVQGVLGAPNRRTCTPYSQATTSSIDC
jgi:hypothetical protein